MIINKVDTLLGALGSIGMYDQLTQNQIIENPINDLLLKASIAILTGVLIPFLNDLRKVIIEKIRNGNNPKGNSDQIENDSKIRFPALGKKPKGTKQKE